MGHTVTILDGGMGRELKRIGAPFQQPEWSALALMQGPQFVRQAHDAFAHSGAQVLTTNSYAVVPFHIGQERFDAQGVALARLSAELARASADAAAHKVLVAGSLPPALGSYRPDLFVHAQSVAIHRALIEGIIDGTITVLATDHAPHASSEKARDFTAAPFGMIGLECALALYIKALVESGAIDWTRLIALMTIEPARLLGIDALGHGRLAQGLPADVTVIDPNVSWKIDSESFHSKSRNCPFEGWQVRGRAVNVFVAGRHALVGGTLPATAILTAHASFNAL